MPHKDPQLTMVSKKDLICNFIKPVIYVDAFPMGISIILVTSMIIRLLRSVICIWVYIRGCYVVFEEGKIA